MFVKKFEAPTFEQAIALVKAEMGPNALVLSTQQKKPARLFKKPSIEITAAFEEGEKENGQGSAEVKDERPKFDEAALERIFPHRGKRMSRPQESTSIRKTELPRYQDVKYGSEYGGKYDVLVSSFQKLGFGSDSSKELARTLVFEFSAKDLSEKTFLSRIQTKLVGASLKTLSPSIFDVKPSWVTLGVSGSGKTSLVVKLALHLRMQGKSVGLKVFREAPTSFV